MRTGRAGSGPPDAHCRRRRARSARLGVAESSTPSLGLAPARLSLPRTASPWTIAARRRDRPPAFSDLSRRSASSGRPHSLPHFMGYRFALFNYATETAGGFVDFDYFRVSDEVTGAR